jgi:hypothetical protein
MPSVRCRGTESERGPFRPRVHSRRLGDGHHAFIFSLAAQALSARQRCRTPACSGTTGSPSYTDIIVNGVYTTSSLSGSYSQFDGYSSSLPLGLTLENVHLDVTDQQGSQDAKVGLYNSNITPSGTGVTTSSVSGSGSVPTCTF